MMPGLAMGAGSVGAEWLSVAGWAAFSYLLGAVPFGLLVGLAQGIDIRTRGSGNIGATNAGRVLGKRFGVIVFLLDFLKGFGPVLLVLKAGPPLVPAGVDAQALALICGGAAVVGHCFPVYLRFKGGKGVAATAGAVLGLRWDAALISFALFFLVRRLSGYVSLASMIMALAFPLAVILLHPGAAFDEYLWITTGGFAVAALIIARHAANIGRLFRGEESRVGGARRNGRR